ncbi:MAG: hypothetical protein AAFU61_06405 [Pseudomonadota bacterium]
MRSVPTRAAALPLVVLAPVQVQAADKAAVVSTCGDIAEAALADSLATAQRLKAAVDALVAAPSAEALQAAKDAGLSARVP